MASIRYGFCLFFVNFIVVNSQQVWFGQYDQQTQSNHHQHPVAFDYGFNLLSLVRYVSKTENQIVSTNCVQQVEWFFENLENFTSDGLWALKMIDASGKIPAGLLKLNIGGWMGEFNECIEIKETIHGVRGKHCLAKISLDLDDAFGKLPDATRSKLRTFIKKKDLLKYHHSSFDASPSIGVCIPDGCTSTDLDNVMKLINVTFQPFQCQNIDDANPAFSWRAWMVLTLFGLIVLIMIGSTLYDVIYCRQYDIEGQPILLAFSVYTNSEKLFKTQKNQSELSCLNGIRVLSMAWVIAGHSFSITSSTGDISNGLDILEYLDTTKSMIFANAVHSVDSFLMVTGLLVVYNYMKSRHAGQKFNLLIFYLHRYVRLTPPFLAVILVSMSLLQYMGSGPNWPFIVNYFQDYCEKSWWSALLYLQNYINVKQWCVGQTWYLNIDWQLYVLSPLFLLPLSWKPSVGLSMLSIALVTFIAIPFYVTWTHHLPALVTNLNGNSDDFQYLYYLRTHTRAAPWFVGALFGFVIFKLKYGVTRSMKYSKLAFTFTWCLVFALIPICIFMGHESLRSENYDRLGNAWYNAMVRPTWAACVGWIALSCSTGRGGIINYFLSLPLFQVLNRFTYSVYLVHVTMLYMIASAAKSPIYFSIFNIAYSFWGITMLSLTLSFFWVLAFESPVCAIEKHFLRKYTERTTGRIKVTTNERTPLLGGENNDYSLNLLSFLVQLALSLTNPINRMLNLGRGRNRYSVINTEIIL